MEVHLGLQYSGEKLGEAGHGLDVRAARGGQTQQAGVLDEENVVLPQPELEFLQVQGAVANALNKGVLMLRLPDGGGFGAQALGELLRHFLLSLN